MFTKVLLKKGLLTILTIVVGQQLSGSNFAYAQIEDELLAHPNKELASFYQANADEIEITRNFIRDNSNSAEDRIQRLDEFSLQYPDAALNSAVELLEDDSSDVAKAAVKLLSSSIVMTDHTMDEEVEYTPIQKYNMNLHKKTRDVLRDVLNDPRQEVREQAARILFSLSDAESFGIVSDNIEQGLYTEAEAVNYFGLSNIDISAEYILPYLSSDSLEAQISAVSYLSSTPEYQMNVREIVYENKQAPVKSRVEASKYLSKYDKSFPVYANQVALDPETPEDVYISTVDGIILQSKRQGATEDEQKLMQLNKDLEAYKKVHPNIKVDQLLQKNQMPLKEQ